MQRMLIAVTMALSVLCAERLGQPLTQKEPMPVVDAVAKAESLAGQTVQVKGKITEVCQMMGCWMQLVDTASGKSIRIKVNDGEIVFPKDSAGKMAIAEGVLQKIVLSKQQVIAAARHEAEEQGRTFDPTAITAGRTVFQIQGTGAVILD